MQKFKDRWEMNANWQLIFPFIGILATILSAYLLSKKITSSLFDLTNSSTAYYIMLVLVTILFTILIIKVTLKLFKPLEKKWAVTYRWELIAIFIAFAVTGSTAARISNPILGFLGLYPETTNGWIYWPLRILLIFPIYQVMLVLVGWVFGQFKFFWTFEKKMLRRMGFARFLKD